VKVDRSGFSNSGFLGTLALSLAGPIRQALAWAARAQGTYGRLFFRPPKCRLRAGPFSPIEYIC